MIDPKALADYLDELSSIVMGLESWPRDGDLRRLEDHAAALRSLPEEPAKQRMCEECWSEPATEARRCVECAARVRSQAEEPARFTQDDALLVRQEADRRYTDHLGGGSRHGERDWRELNGLADRIEQQLARVRPQQEEPAFTQAHVDVLRALQEGRSLDLEDNFETLATFHGGLADCIEQLLSPAPAAKEEREYVNEHGTEMPPNGHCTTCGNQFVMVGRNPSSLQCPTCPFPTEK